MAANGNGNQRQRVLIVEDESLVAADLRMTVEDLGYEVVGVAATAHGALELAEEFQPELVLMDIQLRGAMDGTAAAETIRRRWQLPVVFLTANANDRTIARARAVGSYGYLLKPFRVQELNATMSLAIEQHRSMRGLFAEGTWLRTVLDSLTDAVIATDSIASVLYLNPSAERLTGWSWTEAYGKAIEELCDLRTIAGGPVERCQLRRTLEAEAPIGRERFLLLSRDGQTTPIEDAASPILNAGQLVGAVAIMQNITERVKQEALREAELDRLEDQVKKASDALGDSRAELRALSAHLITTQELEQRRLARELHDDFGQQAAILGMHLERALDHLGKEPRTTEHLLRKMRDEIFQLSLRLREMSHYLHPPVLEDLGLVAALRSLILGFRNEGEEVSFRLPDEIPTVSLDAATALYRIAQEALKNARKHAPGAPIHVTLANRDGALELVIRDAGPGFDLLQARLSGGLGLLSMHERARLVHGSLLIDSRLGDGTEIAVRVPW
jgi:PAS domain S-box-containing protein